MRTYKQTQVDNLPLTLPSFGSFIRSGYFGLNKEGKLQKRNTVVFLFEQFVIFGSVKSRLLLY